MDSESAQATPEVGGWNPKLAILLAMAMFVLVVDTTLMNVSIAAVVEDLGTTVSDVQAAIAIEALVSAAFILISSKVADLIGRKLAYVLGLCAYAVGALTMTLTTSIVPMILFWGVLGGLGASLLLPAMQSLIHGNFAGTRPAPGLRTRRRVGRHRRRGRPAHRRLRDHLSVLAHRLRHGGRDHRRRAARDRAGA